MSKNHIIVVGSSNTDMVIKSDRLPLAGETVLGGQFMMNPGGKGANQAVTVARLGGEVTFVCRVGNDLLGNQAIDNFLIEGINTSFVTRDPVHPTGTALIMVDGHGENSISVALGANAQLDHHHIDQAYAVIQGSAYVLAQLETPMQTILHLGSIVSELSIPLILNPAPAQDIPEQLYESVYILTPNALEAEVLTGIEVSDLQSAKLAAEILRNRGVEIIIITLGSMGAYLSSQDYDEIIPAPKATVVDTTAAGDTFNGALAVALSELKSLKDAVIFANQAAALSVSQAGAHSSIPYRSDLTI